MSNKPSKEYKRMKNYLHNDCGISKDDIRNMVREEVKKQLENISLEETINKEIINVLCDRYGGLKYETKNLIENTERSLEIMRNKAIEKAIAENIVISLKEK